MSTRPKFLTTEEAAQRAGVAVSTWTAYVSRGQAPEPAGFDPHTGRRRWSAATVDNWIANRPGRGARTDLHRTK